MLHYFSDSIVGAVELIFHSDPRIEWSWLAWELKPVEQVKQVMLEDKDSIWKVEKFSELFELLG